MVVHNFQNPGGREKNSQKFGGFETVGGSLGISMAFMAGMAFALISKAAAYFGPQNFCGKGAHAVTK